MFVNLPQKDYNLYKVSAFILKIHKFLLIILENLSKGEITLTLYKLVNKTLITDYDMELNMKYGLPVEIFCPKTYETVAFGPIEKYTKDYVVVNGKKYNKQHYAIFGMQHLSKQPAGKKVV